MKTSTLITIGRDEATGKLKLTCGAKAGTYGDNDSVPSDVSAQHCIIEIGNDQIRLKNLDINNYTYYNNQAVESKTIVRGDRIELGPSHYPLDWRAIDALIPPEADIRSLREVWDAYDRQNIKLQIDERRFNTIRSATGLVTMVAIALSIVTGRQSVWYLVLYAVAILISLLFTIKAYRDSSKIPQKRNELNRQFQHDYACPHCGHFLGNQSYDILAQNHQCPYCRAKFIH